MDDVRGLTGGMTTKLKGRNGRGKSFDELWENIGNLTDNDYITFAEVGSIVCCAVNALS